MKRFLGLLLLLCLMPLGALAGDPSVYCYAVNPDGDTVPVYQKASTSSHKVGDFYVHQPMLWDGWEEDDADGWVKLMEPDVGYIQTRYLVQETYDADFSYSGLDRLPVLTAKGDIPLLEDTSSGSKTTSTLPNGLRLLALGDCGDYYYVEVLHVYLCGFVRKIDVAATGEFRSIMEDTQVPLQAVYPPEGMSFAPAYSDCERTEAFQGGYESTYVYQQLENWAVVSGGFMETRFLDPHGDHSMPTAYTRTSDEASRLLLRWEPRKDEYYAGKYFSGLPVVVLAQSGDYTQVAFGDTCNWFATEYLTDTQTDQRVRAIVPLGATVGYASEQLTLAPGEEILLIGSSSSDMLFLANGRQYRISLEDVMPVEGSGMLSARTTTRLKMHSCITNVARDEVTSIAKGKKVTVLLHGDEYSKIEYNGSIGYVMTKYLQF